MTWIKVISEGEAEGPLREAYQDIARAAGRVSNFFAAHSLNPEAMKHLFAFFRTLMYGPSGLSRAQREMLSLVVSATNRCHH